MRNFIQIIVLFFLLLPKSYLLIAQNVKIGIQAGVGTYKMTDLKNLNEYVSQNNSLNPKITSNYPAFLYYQPTVIFEFKNINLGFLYSHQSTGSRISILDYSGEYRFDSKINSNAFGILSEVKLNPEKILSFRLYSELGVAKTKLNLIEFFKVYDETLLNDKYAFESYNYYFEPGIKISYPNNHFCFEFNLGYLKQFGKETLTGKEVLTNELGDKIKPDWSGFRCGLSVYLLLFH